jgi:hypothetical protein
MEQLAVLEGVALGAGGGPRPGSPRPRRCLAQEVDHRSRIGRRQEDIHLGKLLAQAERIAHADQAAHQADDLAGMALLEVLEFVEPAVGFVLRRLAHDAGVDHPDVGVFPVFSRVMAALFQLRGEELRIGHVHLAAQGPDVIAHCRRLNTQILTKDVLL